MQQQLVEFDYDPTLSQILKIFQRIEINQSPVTNELQVYSQTTKKVLLFLGFDHNIFDQFYQHFDNKRVLQVDQLFKIAQIQKNNRCSILINSPHLLINNGDQEKVIQICSSKINLETILTNLTKLDFHVIVNLQEIEGNNLQERVQNISLMQIFQIGKFNLQENDISIITQVNQQEVSYAYLKSLKPSNEITIQNIQIKETLKQIFKKDKFLPLIIQQQPSDFQYGVMSTQLAQYQDQFKAAINNITEQIQMQLYRLQQLPKLEEEYELHNNLVNYINALYKQLEYFEISIVNLPKIFQKINYINEQTGNNINNFFLNMDQSYKDLNYREFLRSNNYQFNDLLIKSFSKNVQDLKQIDIFFTKYYSYEYQKIQIGKVKSFVINIKFWSQVCHYNLENKLYQFKTLSALIQPGPQEFEKGVFLFGKSRVGKSTLINLIINPQSLTVEEKLDDLNYAFKEQQQNNPQNQIEHGCISETQKITGVEVEGVWYFDCPGFDDNISEFKQLAHRISLYNYLVKAQKKIGFLVIDGSNKDAQVVKDTIDPLYLLIKQKPQLVQEHQKWLSLILVKTKPNTRKAYIDNWQMAYRGLLESYKYSFFQPMYQNDQQCIDFCRPQEQLKGNQQAIELETNKIRSKILNRVQSQLENYEIQLQFELFIENKLFYLVEIAISKLQIKISQIIQILTNNLDEYILENSSNLNEKDETIQKLESIISQDLDEKNIQDILDKLLTWGQNNPKFENQSQFLSFIINDTASCLKILSYCQNPQIMKINIKTEIIRKKMKKSRQYINNIQNICRGLLISNCFGLMPSYISFISIGVAAGCSVSLAMQMFNSSIAKIAIHQSYGPTIGTEVTEIMIMNFQNNLLKLFYENYLKDQESNLRN